LKLGFSEVRMDMSVENNNKIIRKMGIMEVGWGKDSIKLAGNCTLYRNFQGALSEADS
jgi:hypothetical protein